MREGVYEGVHSSGVMGSLRLGMVLFIVSELALFGAFFWAYLDSALAPSVHIGCVWPPRGIAGVDVLGLPLVNTVALLASGATLTAGHHSVVGADKSKSLM